MILHRAMTLLILGCLALPQLAQARPAATLPAQLVAQPLPQAAVESNVPRYDLAIDVDTQARKLTGHMLLQFGNRTGATLQDVVLRLYPNFPPDLFGDGGDVRMDVRNVKANGSPASAAYEAGRTVARIPLPAPVEPGAGVSIELDWNATMRPWQRSDGSFPLPSYYPALAVWDGGWRTDVTRFPDRVFADAAMYRATISVPAGWTVISGGATIGTREEGGKTFFESAIGPAREFAFSVGRFVAARASHAGIAVNVYHKPGDGLDAAAQKVALHVAAALATYGARFGAYPYRELNVHLIDARRGYDIGVEYPGLFYLLLNGRYTDDTRFVAAHETAHQWWYGVVGDDIFNEPWLDEGFAQWAPLLVEEQWAGPAAAERVYRRQIAGLAQRAAAPAGLDLGTYGTWRAYYAAVYGRGAQFLYTLRRELGDDAFFRGLRGYYADNTYGIGTTAKLRAALEASSGRDLRGLFKQWTGR